MFLRKAKELTAAEINALPKSARPIGVEPLSPMEMSKKYADRVRRKKTERDKQKIIKERKE